MHVKTAQELGLVARARRRQLRWSQDTLAQTARVSRWWITEFESGRARAELDPVLRTIVALGLVLDVSAEGRAPDHDVPPLPKIHLDELLAQHKVREAGT